MEASQSNKAPLSRSRADGFARDDDRSSSDESRPSSASSAGMMLPPPPPVQTPLGAGASRTGAAGASASVDQQEEDLETRLSRSASTASRTNRLSLTLPIAPPTAFPSRPMPTSSSMPSFPGTPVDVSSGFTSPMDPADLITAIAAQERHVLEIREELNRAESDLTRLKRQFANHEVKKKRAEHRKTEPLRSLPSKAGTPLAACDTSPDDASSKRTTELDRRKALLLSQQPGSDPNTPTQSRRRVFKGGHARTLSLLSPTKSTSDGFPVHEDQPDNEPVNLPISQEPESPFLQNLGRYAPLTASQLSKRASWAPQSVHQVAGLKQVAGDLTATLWTFAEDIRQAVVGDELAGPNGAMRTLDANARRTDDAHSTIRASASASRPLASRAFDTDVPVTPTPPPRYAIAGGPSDQQAVSKEKMPIGGESKVKAKPARAADGKPTKRFSWTPLTVESYDDSDWSSWDSPTVKASPRWSGSTVNGDPVASLVEEQVNKNAAPEKRDFPASSFSPSTPSANKAVDINWPAALNRLTPGNIKRTATDLMKEWEKSLTPPTEMMGSDAVVAEERNA